MIELKLDAAFTYPKQFLQVNNFLTVHLLRNTEKKERIWYPHDVNSLIDGAYTNNPHVLVRYDVSGPADKFISLVLSQYQKSQDLSYTLSCYCTEPFSLGRPHKDLPFLRELSGSWTPSSAGGPVGKDGFFFNPMYVLNLTEEATMQLRCSTVKTYAGKSYGNTPFLNNFFFNVLILLVFELECSQRYVGLPAIW